MAKRFGKRPRFALLLTFCAVLGLFMPIGTTAPRFGRARSLNNPAGLNSWDNSIAGTENDHVVRIVIRNLDRDVLLTMDRADPLKHRNTNDLLATTYRFVSDGDGFTSSGIQVGGSYGGVPFSQQGHGTFVSAANLMNPGVVVTFAGGDNKVRIFHTSRGRNAEDFGSNSDLTEAPDAGKYEGRMKIRMTWPVP